MSQIDIHPAVVRQEDAALLAFYKNRTLLLAEMNARQSEVIDTLNAGMAEFSGRIEALSVEIAALRKGGDPGEGAETPADDPVSPAGGTAATAEA
jgi:uncharacterized protein YhaN